MDSLAQQLSHRVGRHLGADALIRASEHADFQANGALAAARERRTAPRAVAASIAAAVVDDGVIAGAEAAGPSLLNLTIEPADQSAQVGRPHADPRLDVATPLIR